jgi:hypothetical protein
MIDGEHITEDHIKQLGYRDRTEWLEQTEGGLGGRRAWLLRINVIESFVPDGQSPRQVADLNIVDTDAGTTDHSRADLRDHDTKQ